MTAQVAVPAQASRASGRRREMRAAASAGPIASASQQAVKTTPRGLRVRVEAALDQRRGPAEQRDRMTAAGIADQRVGQHAGRDAARQRPVR